MSPTQRRSLLVQKQKSQQNELDENSAISSTPLTKKTKKTVPPVANPGLNIVYREVHICKDSEERVIAEIDEILAQYRLV